ncbi:hypothetical protein [Lysinibacillus mangiferihumi]|uniref:hypothetical protein n=1 Tax=Lysinibacillus mangiferihumi TaxID=1130819 RepID=UPI00142DF853|nr:hypothetical protein [Lysinibacillus mangiferihumi]
MKKGSTFHAPVKVLKAKSGVPTLIEVNGVKYSLAHQNNNGRITAAKQQRSE